MNETKKLAKFVCETRYEMLPKDIIDKTKQLVLDQLGVQLAVSTKPWSKAIYKYTQYLEAKPEATIVNYGVKTTVDNAAFVNGTFGGGFEIDDTHTQSLSHPGATIIPVALALGEKELTSGRDLILAIVIGYEVMGRIGRATAASALFRGFHTTSIFGVFGAAATAARILGLDSEKTLHALGIAGSYASGLIEYGHTGGQVKRIHPGMAAAGGLRAALLAERGLTGPSAVLEGQRGFCRAVADDYRLEDITDKLGERFDVVIETAFKMYCCGGMIHAPIEALEKILKKHRINPENIEEVVDGQAAETIDHVGSVPEPKDISSTQFSINYCLGLTLAKGSNQFKDYNEENLRDPQVLSMAKKVRLEVDKEMDRIYPAKLGAKVTVKLKNGATYRETVSNMKGGPNNPPTRAEVEDKFRGLATVVLPGEKAEELLKVVNGLETAVDVSELCRLLVSHTC